MTQRLSEVDKLPTYQSSGNQSNQRKYLITALVLIAIIILLYILSRFNYPLFHSLADMATVFIATGVFVVVWNRRRLIDNHFYLFVGIAFLFFALWDGLHLLGNKGMGVFPQYGNMGPELYIISRYYLGISLLVAPLFIKRKLNTTVTFAAYASVTVLMLLSVFYWQNFPVTYVEGVGLTSFKVISDYIICLLLAIAAGLLFLRRRSLDARVFKIFISAMIFFIATGLAFTLYTDPFGVTNAIGHFFQITSFYLVYIAFLQTMMAKPQDILYRNLKQSQENTLKFNTELEEEITERKKVEQALKESEERLRFALESSHTGAWDLDLVDHTAFRSLEHDRIFGYSSLLPEWTYEKFLDHVLLEDRSMVDAKFRHAIETQGDWNFECRIQRIDGTVRWIWAVGRHKLDSEGAPRRMAGIVQDITERKNAEEMVREATQRFQTIVDHAPIAIYIKNRKGQFVFGNLKLEQYTGHPNERLIGKTDYDFAPKEDADRWRENDLKVLGGQEMEFEETGTDRDGHPYVNLSMKFPLTDESGTPVEVCGISMDITERKKVEEARQQMNEELERRVADRTADLVRAGEKVQAERQRFLNMLDTLPVIVDIIRADHRIEWANQAYRKALGDNVGRLCYESQFFINEPCQECQAFVPLQTGQPHHWEWTLPNGRTFDIYNFPFAAADGSSAVLEMDIDITEQRRASAALKDMNETLEQRVAIRTAELESANKELESFSYSVSHDLRAPLRTLDGFSEMILEEYADKLGEDGKDYLNRIRRASHTMSELIEAILKLSRISRAEMHLDKVDLSDLARSISEGLKFSQPERKADFIIEPNIIVQGDLELLRVALNNLLENAWKYTGKCSQTRIELGKTEQQGEKVYFVRDNGVGFDMKFKDKLFQPFQRLHTGNEYPGTGIGLATVQRVIRRHGGRIWAESEVGKGTTFYFTLE